jgi:hypothetical protein
LWIGSIRKDGYGHFSIGKKILLAHRAAYQYFIGPLPSNLSIDHLCRVRCCVNPQHLEPVTTRVNILRGTGFAGINSRKEKCSRGHPFDKVWRSKNRMVRACSICHNEWHRQKRERISC